MSIIKDVIDNKDLTDFYRFITFMEHERIVHLIITAITAAIWLIIMALYLFVSVLFALPGVALLIVLLCYVAYYCKLENAVQGLYGTYERLRRREASKRELIIQKKSIL